MSEKRFIIREDQLEEIDFLLKKHSVSAARKILKQLKILEKDKKEEKNGI